MPRAQDLGIRRSGLYVGFRVGGLELGLCDLGWRFWVVGWGLPYYNQN